MSEKSIRRIEDLQNPANLPDNDTLLYSGIVIKITGPEIVVRIKEERETKWKEIIGNTEFFRQHGIVYENDKFIYMLTKKATSVDIGLRADNDLDRRHIMRDIRLARGFGGR